MKIVIRVVSTSSSYSDSLDIGLRAGWNGGLMSIGGGFGFSQALSGSNSFSLGSVEVYYSGQDRGTGITGLTID